MNPNTGEMLSRPSTNASPPSKPAKTPPIADAVNQSPNICPTYFFGECLEKAARPTGERASSPHV